jgi:hypothetical protein
MDFNDLIEMLPLLFGLLFLLFLACCADDLWFRYAKRSLWLDRFRLENDQLELQNRRAELDLDLVELKLGVHTLLVARRLMEDPALAAQLAASAIEAGRRKPLDELRSLSYTFRSQQSPATQDEAAAFYEQYKHLRQ